MRLRFTKMHGAGNDFVVVDATRANVGLDRTQLRALGDRRYGIGADQILLIEPSPASGVDFGYRIFNGGSGDEVEQCGNGARCVARYVLDHGLTDRGVIRVQTMSSVIDLHALPDGRVRVDMGAPSFEPARLPFDASGLLPVDVASGPGAGLADVRAGWSAAMAAAAARGNRIAASAVDFTASATPADDAFAIWPLNVQGRIVEIATVSMGNPHAVQVVADVDTAPVASQGPVIEAHARFPRHVNAGFVQIVERGRIRLRVYERGAGETLACGTGACAAAVAGMRAGLLDPRVDVEARGGLLTIEWAGGNAPVWMTGDATRVFDGEIDI
ncbi:diaminopimelate epimerase [Piscinibacter koreensis]|uniref:Diaminopimelate epimerase n=1 Tax=Piscinibacter koreensis TaxID=2742824 RepID=A0A7Y6NLX6_9BURK|nr:diaminopimelate epimerase [Schlegelella koreensis]NUZ05512.1 diaminopimelate epimerase [Schlegelella koreensis]